MIEARISHLAYAPEIAGAMLRRQQASAVIAARQKIVEGAVGMVEMALRNQPQGRGAAGRGAQGDHGEQSAGGAVQRPRRAARRQHGDAVSIATETMAERKAFLLRLDPAIYEALQRWADADLRSLNAQIEFLLRRAFRMPDDCRTKGRPPASGPPRGNRDDRDPVQKSRGRAFRELLVSLSRDVRLTCAGIALTLVRQPYSSSAPWRAAIGMSVVYSRQWDAERQLRAKAIGVFGQLPERSKVVVRSRRASPSRRHVSLLCSTVVADTDSSDIAPKGSTRPFLRGTPIPHRGIPPSQPEESWLAGVACPSVFPDPCRFRCWCFRGCSQARAAIARHVRLAVDPVVGRTGSAARVSGLQSRSATQACAYKGELRFSYAGGCAGIIHDVKWAKRRRLSARGS